MGELVVGRPALQVRTALSVPLDLTSIMSLLYRAVPGSGLDPWLVSMRRALPRQLQEDLDLLHGFSGRLLYYMEEPVMTFEPLRPDRIDATIDDLIAFLEELEPSAFRAMAIRAIDRAHNDLGTEFAAPQHDDEVEWRRYLEPVLTTADTNDALELMLRPELLKMRTIRLIRGVWDSFYAAEFAAREDSLREAELVARSAASRGFGLAFAELTGNRLPATLAAGLNNVANVTFCPSAHLGDFVSYITYSPDLVVFFPAQRVIGEAAGLNGHATSESVPGDDRAVEPLAGEELLEAIRAMGDANRLRILDLLGTGELYAQEIVGRLGIAQSAVSRHLSQLERAGLIRVEPRRGMKYYAIEKSQLQRVAESILLRAR
ncbi:MAG TPA: metalloregulator ArsR/SmtB family transcription factor [Thermomicrobiales bacterium]|jgi:DNA-binding transcriptional ArsR family regulator|nr:metalloregulator ArsR/SmtB family transcription factor [Thermomicrobiales bacterium]